MITYSPEQKTMQCTGAFVEPCPANALQALKARTDACFERTRALLKPLSPEAAMGSAENYTRHVAYADPDGKFSIIYLVWRSGQFSPVHAHQTWCAYRVLQGTLHEQHFRWDDASECALLNGSIERTGGSNAVALPGLGQIHRLGNAGDEVAVSLHIYGVPPTEITTGINIVLDSDLQ